jgi:hypothetical protein
LRPGHGRPPFGTSLVLPLVRCPGLVALAPLCGRNECTIPAVRSENAIISSLSCLLVILITTGR